VKSDQARDQSRTLRDASDQVCNRHLKEPVVRRDSVLKLDPLLRQILSELLQPPLEIRILALAKLVRQLNEIERCPSQQAVWLHRKGASLPPPLGKNAAGMWRENLQGVGRGGA